MKNLCCHVACMVASEDMVLISFSLDIRKSELREKEVRVCLKQTKR